MPQYQVIYWRDIPAQVKVREGRTRSGTQLPPRFQHAIDEAAMRAGLIGTDAYLNEWRQGDWEEAEGSLEEISERVALELEEAYPGSLIKKLVENYGQDIPHL